tara:strand:- start:667 stop:1173 length:507 start_codon:yes stop_codon:yes gene_type:complete
MVSTKEEGMYKNSEHIVKLNYNDFIKKNNKVILKNKKKFQKYKGKIGLLKVYAEWCGHCHTVKDVIEEISKILHKDKITIFVIDFANIPLNRQDKFVKTTGVNSFPSFFKVNNLQLKKVEIDDRSKESFLSVIKKMSGGKRRSIKKKSRRKRSTKKTRKKSVVFRKNK